jgi:hypothetical protein
VRPYRRPVYPDSALADPDLSDIPGTVQPDDSGLGDVEKLRGLNAHQQCRAGYTLTSSVTLPTIVVERS